MENPTMNTNSVLLPSSPDGLDYGNFVPATNSPEDTSTLQSGQKKSKSARKLFPETGQSNEQELDENKGNKSICNTVRCVVQGGRKRRKSRKSRRKRKTKKRKSLFKKKRTKRRRKRGYVGKSPKTKRRKR